MYFFSGNNTPKNGVNEVPNGNVQTKSETSFVQNAQKNESVTQTQNVKPQALDKKINCSMDVLQNARRDLIGEIEAIIGYDKSITSADAPNLAKATWEDIRDEELVHVGELLALLTYLAPYQRDLVEQGMKEFKDRMNGK